MLRIFIVCLAALLTQVTLVGTAVAAEKVRILTSFPPQFFEPFQSVFRKRYPEISLEFVQRKTTTAVADIVGERHKADIFWASAPDAFEILKRASRLTVLKPRATGAPDLIAGYPVNDPDLTYLGFALSGYGFVYNPSYLKERGLPVPKGWSDLAAPIYSGHIGISSPSRSGTMHLMVEAILQVYGWDRGWGIWSEIGGNLATVTARSFGVSAGVARGRFGVGPSIDFLAKPEGMPEGSTRFALPEETLFVPASIAVLSGATNRDGAERFIDFVLSPEGQGLLLNPAVARLPISPAAYPDTGTAENNPFQREGLFAKGLFDAGLSAARYELVNIIFDEMITFRRSELGRMWRSLRALEATLLERSDADVAKLLSDARRALTRPPLSGAEAMELERWRGLMRVRRGLPTPEPQAQLEARIKVQIEENMQRAARALADATAILGNAYRDIHGQEVVRP
ncbi:ABC transporter substrate-binding protein [Microvirga guangxiensis]|uniref:ABC-type Fe3+ transport system, substrate-binding protein n=1 Tax=Microvirga guangxiensis TaxID=549386 RepID=A0A1G5ASR1_9HYPH|nr:extracellular solute-binding protein [Microvirga guangxiensis]SCX80932.1 ABC-type Fe3+ transport system, substrate-binding protein [Microvirga guangxiensis]